MPANTVLDRKSFLGGSEAAAACGMSRWKTMLQLWAEKTGQVEPDQTDSLQKKLGRKLEPTVIELFEEDTGLKTERYATTMFHPEHPCLGANIDRVIVGENSIVEAKTAAPWKRDEWEGEKIPVEYLLQGVHYLAVTGAKRCYFPILLGNQDFKVKVIDRDEKLIADLVRREVKFWNEFVVPKVMPMAITKDDGETLYRLFPEGKGEIDLGDDAAKLCESIQSLNQDLFTLEGTIEKQKNELKALLGDHELGRLQKWQVSWKDQVSKRLDTERIKKEAPETYERFLKEIPTRVLRIKEKKDVDTK